MTLNIYLSSLDLWNVWTMRCCGTHGTFWQHCSQSCMYSYETTWHLWWKIPLENPWKRDFRDSKFQNVPRFLGPKKLVSLVWVPKLPTIHNQPANEKIFDSLDPTLLAESFFHLLDFGVLKKDCMSSISLYMHLLHVARIQAKQPHASYSRLSLMTIALSINCFSHLKRQFEQWFCYSLLIVSPGTYPVKHHESQFKTQWVLTFILKDSTIPIKPDYHVLICCPLSIALALISATQSLLSMN